MRRRTAYALVGAVAGTMLLGTGGTMATFTDSATLTGSVGAGEFALTVTPQVTPLRLAPGNGNSSPLTVTRTGSGDADLLLSVVDGLGDNSCRGNGEGPGKVQVTVLQPATRSQGSAANSDTVDGGLCSLRRGGALVLPLPDGVNSAELVVKITAPGQGWNGSLRFTLQQQGGGFSDTQDLSVQVSPGNR